MHGGFNHHELNTVLILGGAAHRGESDMLFVPAGIIDIAPTILDLLDLAPPPACAACAFRPGCAPSCRSGTRSAPARSGNGSRSFAAGRICSRCMGSA